MKARRYTVQIGLLGLLVLGMSVLPAITAPQPSEAQVAWRLDFQYDEPKYIQVTLPGEALPTGFWYMTFHVTNRTGEDRLFAPSFTLYTDTGQIIRAGENVNPVVFDYIKKIENNPLLEDLIAMTGKLLQGEDNARDGVAIFKNFDPKAAKFDIFISGLSGEIAQVNLPNPVEVQQINAQGELETVQTKTVLLSRTLHLGYAIGTEARDRIQSKVKFLVEKWVMR
jgi:hypothetical protein